MSTPFLSAIGRLGFPFSGSAATERLDTAHLPLSAWLLRPYLDLGPLSEGPLHAHTIELAFHCFADPAADTLPFQMHPGASLRAALIQETQLTAYAVRRVEDLPDPLRTARWQQVVDAVRNFAALDESLRMRLVQLLVALGLYDQVNELFSAGDRSDAGAAASDALSTKLAFAAWKSSPGGATSRANLDSLAALASNPAADPRSRLSASCTLVVCYARGRCPDPSRAARWRQAALRDYRRLRPHHHWKDAIYASMFWRAASYTRYLAGDRAATARELDRAEQFARAVGGETEVQRWIAAQNLHPLLETRTKAALWAGEWDRAVEYARELARHDPLDPKVHVNLGRTLVAGGRVEEACRSFRAAAFLGAPYTAAAWFLAGECMEKLGDLAGASDAYRRSCAADPNSYSSAKRLAELCRRTGEARIGEWASSKVETLGRRMRSRLEIRAPVRKATGPRRSPAPARAPGPMHYLSAAPESGHARTLADSRSPAADLLRPYLDLSGPGGPNHARIVAALGEALLADSDGGFPLQLNTPTHFRPALLREVGVPEYAVRLPRELPPSLRSGPWSRLCELLEDWPALKPDRKLPVVRLLNKLGLYEATLHYLPPVTDEQIVSGDVHASLAIHRANALFKCSGGRPDAETDLRRVVDRAPDSSGVRLVAALNMVVHHGKLTRNLETLSDWADFSGDRLAARDRADTGLWRLQQSAGLRGLAYVPFLGGDAAGTAAALDEAERLAWSAASDPAVPDLVSRENLLALLETRVWEALRFGDPDLAWDRARTRVALDPLDPRTHILLAEVLRVAGRREEALAALEQALRLGAPETAKAWYLTGQLHEETGCLEDAGQAYLEAIQADPWAVSAYLRVHALCQRLGWLHVRRWSAERILHLRSQVRQSGGSPSWKAA